MIEASLDLLNRPAGPVLEDYPETLPEKDLEALDFCPVNFAQPAADAQNWVARLANERLLLQPWYAMSKRRRGRTTSSTPPHSRSDPTKYGSTSSRKAELPSAPIPPNPNVYKSWGSRAPFVPACFGFLLAASGLGPREPLGERLDVRLVDALLR